LPGGASLEQAFGPVAACVHTRSARGHLKPKERGQTAIGAWFLGTVQGARFNGDYRITPFFDIQSGAPVATPHVLSVDDRARLMQMLQA
jgi:hypothetical protein